MFRVRVKSTTENLRYSRTVPTIFHRSGRHFSNISHESTLRYHKSCKIHHTFAKRKIMKKWIVRKPRDKFFYEAIWPSFDSKSVNDYVQKRENTMLRLDQAARKSRRDRIYDDKTESSVTWARCSPFCPLPPLSPSLYPLYIRSFMLSPRLCSVWPCPKPCRIYAKQMQGRSRVSLPRLCAMARLYPSPWGPSRCTQTSRPRDTLPERSMHVIWEAMTWPKKRWLRQNPQRPSA